MLLSNESKEAKSQNRIIRLKNEKHTETIKVVDRKQVLQRIMDNMVYIEGGTYLMGSKYKSHRPKVTVSSFYLGRYEVTQEEWVAVMGQNPSRFKGLKMPVENISWEQANQFVEKLNLLTKRKFRLPTEAEWEYAARGGKFDQGNRYSGSNDISLVAWSSGLHPETIHNVGMKQPNELGIYDMSGNVYEWCYDFYKAGFDYEVATNPCNLQKQQKVMSFEVEIILNCQFLYYNRKKIFWCDYTFLCRVEIGSCGSFLIRGK